MLQSSLKQYSSYQIDANFTNSTVRNDDVGVDHGWSYDVVEGWLNVSIVLDKTIQ